MKKMVFSCNWGNNTKRAWSGTKEGIYSELVKYYDVEQFNINTKILPLLPFRILEKLKLCRCDRMYQKYYSRLFKKKLKHYGQQKVFQFDECPEVFGTENYIYQDLSISYLRKIVREDPKLYSFCGLNMSHKYMEKRYWAQKKFYQEAKGIFTMGQWLADYLIEVEKIPAFKVHKVGAGINIDINQIDSSKKEGNKILFVGRDFKRKGGELVINAFRILKKINPKAQLYVAGPSQNPVKDELEGYHFLGDVDREQLVQYYNMCDVFCMPSYFEAYGIVFGEALCFGLPCIVRNAFAMKEFITDGENGYLIGKDDVDDLADKMHRLLGDESIRRHVISKREWYVNEYSWMNTIKKIVDVIG